MQQIESSALGTVKEEAYIAKLLPHKINIVLVDH